ncbi:MAG: homogentisate 1,2-dioxygenase [Salibacteraceae bacterium]
MRLSKILNMPFYQKLGNVPVKRHTINRKENGELLSEQVFGTAGFVGMTSILYHLQPPTLVVKYGKEYSVAPEIAIERNLKMTLLKGMQVKPEDDFLESRKTVLTNATVNITLAAPKKSLTEYFYKNADSDEVIFIHKGTGTLRTLMGNIPFEYGDYLVVPRGMVYQIEFDTADNRLFIVESKDPIFTPKSYRNNFGQLLEHSPFCERDFHGPSVLETHDEMGEFMIKIRKQDVMHEVIYASHPFDVAGWDGYNFPYKFSIHDFEPITGRIHQPPPVHQTFEAASFVICSFVPRMYDYHPESIPAPYNHSNIDSDELLYYVAGDFMSRNDIEVGHISLHPAGLVHGPHPGAAERSIGKTKTEELAVMVDTFAPLKVTKVGVEISDPEYYKSWANH